MAAAKPNNLPWIVLGVVLGAGALGLFGYGAWQGFQAERGIILSSPPSPSSEATLPSNVITISVNGENTLSVDGQPKASISDMLSEFDGLDLDDTLVILRMSEDTSHKTLVEIKGNLDKLGVYSKIEILRSAE